MCFLFKIPRQSRIAAWSMPRLNTTSAPVKMILRPKTISPFLRLMLVGVKRARTSIAMPIRVNAHALTKLYPLTNLFGKGATAAYCVASIESDLFIEHLLLLLDKYCPRHDREIL